MFDRNEFLEEIMGLETIDTHTHLIGDQLGAQDFWKIANYFWLFRELQTAGYPSSVEGWAEKDKISAFLKAYHGSRNTWMNMAFTSIFKDLYGISITDEASIHEANEAVKASSVQGDWAQRTADRLHVTKFIVNYPEHCEFHGMREDAELIPRIDGKLHEWVKQVREAANRADELERVTDQVGKLLASYQLMQCPGVMTTLPSYKASAHLSHNITNESSDDELMICLLHAICKALESRGMFLQLFLGVERSWCSMTPAPVNDTERILKLYGLFEKYAIDFELVVASELNNLDVVQAGWNFPNVHVGGMWWYNFRASTYKMSMQYRLEALAPIKSSLIVSDARCIEWTYGKILLVKKLLAQFLAQQIEAGWLDKETALFVAKGWLYDSAAARYRL